MARVNDVAAFILEKAGPMTAMKLQKLIYYCQAWSLVWDERPMFTDRIEAWANGPVCPALYAMHRGRFNVGPMDIQGRPDQLDADAKETAVAVLEFYGPKSAQWLSDLAHSEPSWREARGSLNYGERGGNEITHAAMAEYYGGLI